MGCLPGDGGRGLLCWRWELAAYMPSGRGEGTALLSLHNSVTMVPPRCCPFP